MVDMTLLQEALRAEVAKRGTQAAVAKWLGVSRSYVCDILAGNRTAGPELLAKLGLEKVVRHEVTYRRAAK